MEKEFLCLKEAAQLFGISDRTMRKIIDKNGIHVTKLNGKLLINKNLLLDFINNNSKIQS